MNYIKLFYQNLKHIPTSGTAIITLAAWVINNKMGIIPKDVADALLMLIQAIVLTFLVGSPKEPVK